MLNPSLQNVPAAYFQDTSGRKEGAPNACSTLACGKDRYFEAGLDRSGGSFLPAMFGRRAKERPFERSTQEMPSGGQVGVRDCAIRLEEQPLETHGPVWSLGRLRPGR
jgi:hypothetical protein